LLLAGGLVMCQSPLQKAIQPSRKFVKKVRQKCRVYQTDYMKFLVPCVKSNTWYLRLIPQCSCTGHETCQIALVISESGSNSTSRIKNIITNARGKMFSRVGWGDIGDLESFERANIFDFVFSPRIAGGEGHLWKLAPIVPEIWEGSLTVHPRHDAPWTAGRLMNHSHN
jgi:hypothetical protein